MKNMRIARKLIVSFVIVIALAVTVGAFGIVGMYMMNVADDGLYNGNYLPTVMAGHISQTVVEQRIYSRNFVIYDATADADAFASSKADLDSSKNNMKQLLDEYEGTIVEQDDQAAYDELVKLYNNEWLPGLDKIYDFGYANQTEDAKAALQAIAPVAEEMDKLTSNLQDINLNAGKVTVDGNTDLFMTMAILEVVILIATVVIALALAFYISGLISKPIVVLTAFMNKAGSTGDIALQQEDMENIKRFSQAKDEIGQCIDSTAKFIKHVTVISEELGHIAEGDLSIKVDVLSNSDVMGLALQKMIDNLNNMFGEINNATSQVSTGSKQIADGAQSLAQGSTEQAAAVEELSSSISEIAQKTQENAGKAFKAAELSGAIKNNAQKGSDQMSHMMQAVKEINDASNSISKVIKVIDDIAFQTNILALNAAVEAARAGQHGKGFAVVAEEVRSLAAKSAEAAKDTGGLIANSIEKAQLGAKIADETAASLNQIVEGINESTEIVNDIARSSEEQSAGIKQINTGIDQVAQVVQQNSATAEESAAASEEMSSQSNLLEQLVAQFKLRNDSGMRRPVLSAASAEKSSKLAMPPKTMPGSQGDFGKY